MSSSHLGQNDVRQACNFVASKENPPFMNFTLMNLDPMNLWTRDRWTESGIAKMKKVAKIRTHRLIKTRLGSKKNHLVHQRVQFVRIQWRKTGVGEWINVGHRLHVLKNNAGKEKNMKTSTTRIQSIIARHTVSCT